MQHLQQKQEYSQLQGDEDGEHRRVPNHGQNRKPWLAMLCSFTVGILTMGVLVAICRPYMAISVPEYRKFPEAKEGTDSKTGLPLSWSHGDCGNSPQDAIARGCQYSIVLHAWLPPKCLTEADIEDQDLMYKDRSWPYQVTEGGHNLTIPELRGGDYSHFTTTFDWHVTHCMYVWKRIHRILMDPKQQIDTYTANFHHTKHCVNMIGGHPGGMKDSGTKIFVKYPKCA